MTAREALKEFVDAIEWLEAGDTSGYIRKQFSILMSEARAVLAKPERNCEVGTVEEQMKKFRQFCESHKPAESEFTETGELLCPASGCELGVCNYGQCALKWAQMPYEAEK